MFKPILDGDILRVFPNQSVKLHKCCNNSKLDHLVAFENILCCNLVLLYDVTL